MSTGELAAGLSIVVVFLSTAYVYRQYRVRANETPWSRDEVDSARARIAQLPRGRARGELQFALRIREDPVYIVRFERGFVIAAGVVLAAVLLLYFLS